MVMRAAAVALLCCAMANSTVSKGDSAAVEIGRTDCCPTDTTCVEQEELDSSNAHVSLFQTSASLHRGKHALNTSKAAMLPSVDCASIQLGIEGGLRAAGFNIPRNGRHTGMDDASGEVEGGSSRLEMGYLSEAASFELSGLPDAKTKVICQTGFNDGRSATAFLCQSPKNTQLVSWDLGDHGYVKKASELIQAFFPGRHRLALGDSTKTLPEAIAGHGPLQKGEKCDLVFVDGGHVGGVPLADIQNFAQLSHPNALLIVDDCDSSIPTATADPVVNGFLSAVASGLVTEIGSLGKGFENGRHLCVGRYTNKAVEASHRNPVF